MGRFHFSNADTSAVFALMVIATAVGGAIGIGGSWAYWMRGTSTGPAVHHAMKEKGDLELQLRECRAGRIAIMPVRDVNWASYGSFLSVPFGLVMFGPLAYLAFQYAREHSIEVPEATLRSHATGWVVIPLAIFAATMVGFSVCVPFAQAYFDYLNAAGMRGSIELLRESLSLCLAGAKAAT